MKIPPLTISSYSSGHLFFIAKEAYNRTTLGAKSDQDPGKVDAIVAIIFSAISLEAFINELTEIASNKNYKDYFSESVQSFAEVLSSVEESRGSTQLKYMLTNQMFTGSVYKKGQQPYQDFLSLFKLRDSLVHLKPQSEHKDTLSGITKNTNKPKVVEGLPKNLLAKFEDGVSSNWISSISTRAMARWACNTSSQMVNSVLTTIPEGYFREMVLYPYTQSFKSVDKQ
jgi:hypothetical protein